MGNVFFIKRIRLVVLTVLALWSLLFGGIGETKAQQSIGQIRQEINTYFPSNITRAINASRLRETLNDILDNVQADTISGVPPKTIYKWPSTSMFSAGIFGSNTSTSRYSIFSHADGTERLSVYYNQGYNRSLVPLLTEKLIAGASAYVTPPSTIHASSANSNTATYLSAGENDLMRLKMGWAGASEASPANNALAAQVIALDNLLAIASRSNIASSIAFYTNDTENQAVRRWDISRYGHLIPFLNNTYDVGSASAAVRSGYFGTSVVSSKYQLSALNTAPANATATGTAGEIRVTANYIYVCTAANTWVRAALTTW